MNKISRVSKADGSDWVISEWTMEEISLQVNAEEVIWRWRRVVGVYQCECPVVVVVVVVTFNNTAR